MKPKYIRALNRKDNPLSCTGCVFSLEGDPACHRFEHDVIDCWDDDQKQYIFILNEPKGDKPNETTKVT